MKYIDIYLYIKNIYICENINTKRNEEESNTRHPEIGTSCQ